MTILKKIFGTKTIDPQKTFDTVASGIDKLFFTAEEKSEASQKAWDQWIEWYKLNSDENSARSKTRRILAILFASFFLFLLLAAAALYWFNEAYSAFLFDLAKEIFPLVSGIMLFYFGYYGWNSIVKNKKETNSK
ncbi:hypothetical protein [Maribellus mangrovi]|uniref:hypothetical protein n=1 Tax=Maribellus mangrovi TaxID=3133146 RepID=UPI0030ED2689